MTLLLLSLPFKMKSQLNRYYLYGIVPAFIIFSVTLMMSDFINASFYMLGFVWPYSYYTPGLKEKLSKNYGNLSFLSMSFRAHEALFDKVPSLKLAPLVRLLAPLIFVSLLSLISFSYSFLWVWLGWLHFELFFLLNLKLSLNLIE
jgi:hypothetical protein